MLKSSFRPALLLGAFALLPAINPTSAADEKGQPLRYGWKQGQTYAYTVTIEVDQGDYLDILSGTPTITVTKATVDGIQLNFRGGLIERQQAKPGKRIIFGPGRVSPFSPFTGVGGSRASELTINDRGELISANGSSQLPYLLGNLSQLMILPLPKDADNTWKITRDTGVSLTDSRFPRPPIGGRDDGKVLKAVQETSYTIDSTVNDTVTINKKSEFRTTETNMGKPRFEIVGDGKLTFDRKTGLATTMEYQQKLFVREGAKMEETPIKITFKLLSEEERAKLAATIEGAGNFPNEPLTEALQTQILGDLKGGNKSKMLQAMHLLSNKEPAKPNKEISQALEALLTEKDTRFSASRALIRWATPDSIPVLIKLVDDTDVVVRHNAMDALGKLKATAAAEAIAAKLANVQDRHKASPALAMMGPGVEPAVLKYAEDKEWTVRHEVCKILKTNGTAKSIPTLTAMQNDTNALVKRTAKEALDAINSRK